MTTFKTHTIESAPAASKAILEGARKQLGFVPNLYANLAEAPAALDGYTTLSGIFDRTSLTPVERQVVLLAVSVENACELCVAAHSVIAKNFAKAPAAIVTALRAAAALPDPRLDALARFARAIVRDRGWVDGPPLEQFLAAGYTQQQAIEVVLGVGLKTISNYVNHLTGTQTNEQFASEAWKKKQQAA